ncbi:MAG: serine O-acetyltransferase [Sphingomonadales bacterium]
MTLSKRLSRDIDAALARDPAARSRGEVIFAYPGFHAVLIYRLAHALWVRGWRLPGRMISQLGRWLTGIEIHPGATIGGGFFIDHGMGVVIGETAEIGEDVTLYQGVTLGGVSLEKGKRHPTLMDGVIVGAGAKVLGPITLGHCARVGSNAVVVKDVAENVTVVGIPAKAVRPRSTADSEEFCPYGTQNGDLPDPVSRSINALLNHVQTLASKVERLEQELETQKNDEMAALGQTGPDEELGLGETVKAPRR